VISCVRLTLPCHSGSRYFRGAGLSSEPQLASRHGDLVVPADPAEQVDTSRELPCPSYADPGRAGQPGRAEGPPPWVFRTTTVEAARS
jgi:hypothetical protein